jgi:DNA gyrase subunit B
MQARFTGRDTLRGLTAIVALKHPQPQFESQTKLKLFNPEVRNIVASAVSAVFRERLDNSSEEAHQLAEHIRRT